MPHHRWWFAAVIIATIVVGLYLDQTFSWGQPVVSVWTWLLFGVLLWSSTSRIRTELIACVLIAGTGEMVCALLWGAYEYRLGNVPLFVPPGHALLYWLGVQLAGACSPTWQKRLVKATLLGATALAVGLAVPGLDRLSVALVALLGVCVWRGRDPALYAVMFWLALTMELYGTALGNWYWQPITPYIGLNTLNPPFAAGVFYAVLDVLVAAVARRVPMLTEAPQPSQIVPAPVER